MRMRNAISEHQQQLHTLLRMETELIKIQKWLMSDTADGHIRIENNKQ